MAVPDIGYVLSSPISDIGYVVQNQPAVSQKCPASDFFPRITPQSVQPGDPIHRVQPVMLFGLLDVSFLVLALVRGRGPLGASRS